MSKQNDTNVKLLRVSMSPDDTGRNVLNELVSFETISKFKDTRCKELK